MGNKKKYTIKNRKDGETAMAVGNSDFEIVTPIDIMDIVVPPLGVRISFVNENGHRIRGFTISQDTIIELVKKIIDNK